MAVLKNSDAKYCRTCIICGETHGYTNELDEYESISTTLQKSICNECKEAIVLLRQAIKDGKI